MDFDNNEASSISENNDNNNDNNNMNGVVESSTPEIPQQESQVTNPSKFKHRGLFIAGPLVFVVGLAVSFLMLKNNPVQNPETYVQEEDSWVEGLTNTEYLEYAPHNPLQVVAYSDATMSATLVSGESYDHPYPYFEWEPGTTSEPGKTIVGYNVYFGTVNSDYMGDHPLAKIDSEVHYVEEANFSPSVYGIELQQGTTYYLYIQAVSDGLANKGYDRDLGTPSKIYFVYNYQ